MQRLVLIAILVGAMAAFSRGHRYGSVRASVASERSPQTIGPRSDSIKPDRSLEPDRRLDDSVVLLGLDNGRTYRIDVRNELLILHRDEIAIDTVVTGSIDHYEPAIVTFDSTILAYEAVSRGMPTMGDTYLFCVLADTLHTAAKFIMVRIPRWIRSRPHGAQGTVRAHLSRDDDPVRPWYRPPVADDSSLDKASVRHEQEDLLDGPDSTGQRAHAGPRDRVRWSLPWHRAWRIDDGLHRRLLAMAVAH